MPCVYRGNVVKNVHPSESERVPTEPSTVDSARFQRQKAWKPAGLFDIGDGIRR